MAAGRSTSPLSRIGSEHETTTGRRPSRGARTRFAVYSGCERSLPDGEPAKHGLSADSSIIDEGDVTRGVNYVICFGG
eukprot:7940908-Pyramimonas_sp.AAC.1